MTIQRHKPWGTAAPLPIGAPVAHGNASLRRLVLDQREHSISPSPIGVIGGDLWRVAGAPSGGRTRLSSSLAQTVPIDLIRVEADATTTWACVHVIARKSWWVGPVVAAMNVDRFGDWRMAPGAHPNDGRLHVLHTGVPEGPKSDTGSNPGSNPEPKAVTSASLSFRQRLLARRRLISGAHLPHPDIAMRRVERAEFRFDRPVELWLDGEHSRAHRHLVVSVEPDAATIVF